MHRLHSAFYRFASSLHWRGQWRGAQIMQGIRLTIALTDPVIPAVKLEGHLDQSRLPPKVTRLPESREMGYTGQFPWRLAGEEVWNLTALQLVQSP